MFQESLVESSPLQRIHNRWPVILSIATQSTILAIAISIPLLHPEVLPTHALNRLNFLPAPRVRPPAPPPQPVRIQAVPTTSTPSAPQMQAPQIPATAAQPFTSDAQQVKTSAIAMVFGSGTNTTPFSPATAAPIPHVVPTPTAPSGPFRVSEGVLAGNLLAPIHPQYPAIARVSSVQGTVIIQAIISTSGTIESAHVISGPAMLQGAALDAVRSARYRPYLLNHRPTEVETTFSINFRLGS